MVPSESDDVPLATLAQGPASIPDRTWSVSPQVTHTTGGSPGDENMANPQLVNGTEILPANDGSVSDARVVATPLAAVASLPEAAADGISMACGDIFRPHTDGKASTARKVANACLSVEAYVTELPPWAALTLYQSHVDPHLTGGAEVAPHVRAASLTQLASVQKTYLQRMLGINPKSVTTLLFTETGLWPIQYRRLALAIRHASYVVSQRPPLPFAALAEARTLATAGNASWLGDLHHALQSLPVPVEMEVNMALTADYLSDTLSRLRNSLVSHLRQEVMSSQCLVILAARPSRSPVLERRDYLSIPNQKHRAALIRLLASDHPLVVEQMRRRTPPVPREWRVCRFCARRGSIEDEAHTLLRFRGQC